MNKISVLNWLNLVVSIFGIIVGISSLVCGHITIGVLNIVAGLFNMFIFLNAVSNYWDLSDKVHAKFIFTCPRCGHTFVPTFWRWFFVPHIGSRRYFKCAACKKYSYMRRK